MKQREQLQGIAMPHELGRQRIHAFADGERGGNPAYVIASTEPAAARQRELIAIARAQGCEVTHLHFTGEPGTARARFYVPTGEIAFCGHGALAAAAWAMRARQAQDRLLLVYQGGEILMQRHNDGQTGFTDTAGNVREHTLTSPLLRELRAMLGLPDLQGEDVTVHLGGKQRRKALIALSSPRWLARISLDAERRDRFCRQHELTGIYPFAVSAHGDILSRHFPLAAGLDEDMATGNIAPTVAALVCGDRPWPLNILQGGPNCDTARLLLQPTEDGLWFVGGYCRHIA